MVVIPGEEAEGAGGAGEGDLAGKRGEGDRAEGEHEARGEGQPSFCNLAGILSSGLM